MRAVAERNVEAILDAAERLLRERRDPNISAVATEAGLSRPTVYAHFSDRTRLIEAVVHRAVRHAMAEVDKVELDRGSATAALERLIDAAWDQIASATEIADAALAALPAEGMRRSHASGRDRVGALIERGRRTGEFRDDVPVGFLVTACFALIHAAREDVSAGVLDAEAARVALRSTVPALVAGR
jgi:TetR/AcrR family transcriptional regulator, mexCD-oprJ operon repressor